MLKITKRLVFGALCLGLAFNVQAQDTKKTKEGVKHVKMVVVDKDGKKHVIDETYTGDMPESLKKKIAELKTKLKESGADIHFDHKDHGKSKFFFKSDDKNADFSDKDFKGDVKIIIMNDDEIMPEEMKKKLAEMKEKMGKDGENFDFDIKVECDDIIEIEGVHGDHAIKSGQVIIKKDGKEILNEKFEGKMPESLKNKIKELKENDEEGEIDIEIKIEADGDTNLHQKHNKVKVIRIGDEELKEGEKVIEIKMNDTDGEHPNVWIKEDGEKVEIDGEGRTFHIDVEVDEDGEVRTSKSFFIVHVVQIEDIELNDKDIPEEFRFRDQPKLDESISDLNFYPNPNDGNFNLNFNLKEQGNTAISIFDLNGKEIYREDLNDFTGGYSKELNLKNQPKGIYILKISQGEKVLSKKLVIQ